MSVSVIGKLFSSLYSLVRDEAQIRRAVTRTEAGHVFEDVTTQKIYSHARSLGLKLNPPRCMLNLPTFSGGCYQFDASFIMDGVNYVIECKRTKIPAKVHIHYFNSQILDYLLGARMRKENLKMKGIFLSTVKVKDSSMIYAIAHGITVIDPVSPPIEHMLSTVDQRSVLSKAIKTLSVELPMSSWIFDLDHAARKPASSLFKEYRFLCKRWMDELEAHMHA